MPNYLKKPITIEAPQYGLAPSALLGFADIRNLNITEKPGVCYPDFTLANDNNTTPVVDGKITKWALPDIYSGSAYCISDDATNPTKVFERETNNSYIAVSGLATAAKLNIVYYKGYYAVIYDNRIEWIVPSDNSIITTGWTSAITSGGAKAVFKGQDDALYISSAYGLDKIEENSGETFAPGSPSTYTITKNKITTPEYIESLDEISNSAIIQTDKKIYLWDFVSSDVSSVVKVNKSINQMIAYNNLVYFQAGDKGEWFITNGTTVEPFVKLPETLLNIGRGSLSFTNIVVKDELFYFGVYSTGTINPIGIYSLNPRSRAIVLAHSLSTGQDGSGDEVLLGGLLNINGVLVIGYRQETSTSVKTFHVNYLSNIEAIGDKAFFVTQLLQLGGRDVKTSIRGIDLQLSKPQVANDSVKVYHRKAITGTWTQLGSTWDTDGQQSTVLPAIDNIENIQFKVVSNNEAEFLKMTIY